MNFINLRYQIYITIFRDHIPGPPLYAVARRGRALERLFLARAPRPFAMPLIIPFKSLTLKSFQRSLGVTTVKLILVFYLLEVNAKFPTTICKLDHFSSVIELVRDGTLKAGCR